MESSLKWTPPSAIVGFNTGIKSAEIFDGTFTVILKNSNCLKKNKNRKICIKEITTGLP